MRMYSIDRRKQDLVDARASIADNEEELASLIRQRAELPAKTAELQAHLATLQPDTPLWAMCNWDIKKLSFVPKSVTSLRMYLGKQRKALVKLEEDVEKAALCQTDGGGCRVSFAFGYFPDIWEGCEHWLPSGALPSPPAE